MELIHSLLREFHTIKGLAGFVNHELIQRIAHQIETRLDDCRKGNREADREVIDLILTASDYIKRFCEDPSLLKNPEFTYAIETYLNKVDIVNAGMKLGEPPETHSPETTSFIPTPETAGVETPVVPNNAAETTDAVLNIAEAIDIDAEINGDSDNTALGTEDSGKNDFTEDSVVGGTSAFAENTTVAPGALPDGDILSDSVLAASAVADTNFSEDSVFGESDAVVASTGFSEDSAFSEGDALAASTALAEVDALVEQIQVPEEKYTIPPECEAEYLKTFIDETHSYLDIFERALLKFEKEPENKEIINEMFRSMHTIKGMASAMGFINLTALSHGIENLLQDIRDDQLIANPNLIELLYLGHDHLTDSLQLIKQTGKEAGAEQDGLLEKLHEILAQLRENRSTGSPDSEKAPEASHLPGLGIDPDFLQETMKGIMDWVSKVELKLLLLETPAETPALILSLCEYFVIINRLAHLVLAEQIQNIARHAVVLLKKINSGELPVDRAVVDWLVQSTAYLKTLGSNFELNVDQKFTAAIAVHLNQFPANDLEIADVDRASLDGAPVQKLGNILMEQEKLTLAEVTELLARQKADAPELRLGQLGVKEGKIEPEELRESLKVQQESMINLEPVDRLNSAGKSGREKNADPFATFRKMYGLETPQAKPKIGQIMVANNIISQDELDQLLIQQKEGNKGLKLGQMVVAEKKAEPREIIQSLRTQEHETKTLSPESDNVRVSITKVDNLVDMVGELLIIQSLIEQEANQRFNSNDYFMTNLLRMARITKDIQNMSMSLRMISLKSTFQKINRVARDAITQLNKNISFQLYGEETEIDRGVAEKILDPLIHLVKNAISHGIEPESVRASLGKPAQGLVKVEASSKRGYIFIDVSDDGKGMDIDAIRHKALEKKLIEPGASYTTEEILNLVFLPGFSTAETINNISGRGVGLDVVKTEMQKIGGKVEINSQPGQGSLFTLKIPINFAVFNGIIISIAGMNFIIPTQNVRRIVQIKPEQWVHSNNKKMITIREDAFQVIPIFKALGLTSPESAILAVVLELDGKSKALPIDGIVGKREIVLKPLGNEFSNLSWIAGASILGDGKVSLILDVENIFKMMEEDVG
jgi:two-component system chemotaxis sensor kinase CheA